MEIEALQAILMDDLKKYDGMLPNGWTSTGESYLIDIKPSEDDSSGPSTYPMEMEMVFAHTPEYPDEPPCYRLMAVRGLSDAQIAEAMSKLAEVVEQNIGMAMIYSLVTTAQEWLRGEAHALHTLPARLVRPLHCMQVETAYA